MEEIHKTLELGVQQLEKYQRDVQEISAIYHSRLIGTLAEPKPTNGEYLPDIVGIGGSSLVVDPKSMQNGAIYSQSDASLRVLSSDEIQSFDSIRPQMSLISIEEEEAANAVILKNQELRSK